MLTRTIGDGRQFVAFAMPEACIAGAGQMIVTPNFLLEHRPDLVMIRSPIDRAEITPNWRQWICPPQASW